MKILIDTDPGVDDAIALLFALRHPELEVVGVTTVGGNAGLANTTANAAGILHLAGADDIPLVRGAEDSPERSRAEDVHGAGGLSGVRLDPGDLPIKDGAAEFIVDTLRANPGEIRLVTLGPLTNLAEALKLDPELPKFASGLSIMGGAWHGGNMSQWAEFNIHHDPGAAATVFEAGFADLRMVGLDATNQAVLTPGLRELCYQFGLAGDPVGAVIHDITRAYLNRYWQRNRVLGCRVHDLLPIALLVDEQITESIPAKVQVQVGGEQDGRTVVDTDGEPNARVYTDSTDNSRLMPLLMRTLFPDQLELLEPVLAHEFR